MYAYFGHHRCATMWTAALVKGISRELGLPVAQEDRYNKLPDGIDSVGFLIHLNATQEIADQLANTPFRGFHVIRDPRDILVSSYFSDKYSHPVYRQEFADFREQLNTLDFDEGLKLELDRRTAEFDALANWDYHNPKVYETRYEVLTTKPHEEFTRILAFLGIHMPTAGAGLLAANLGLAANRILHRAKLPLRVNGIPPAFLQKLIDAQAFQKLAGRKKGEEDAKSHYRKGVAGDWVNHLTGANKALFKERWGSLLINLGYEQDLNW